MLDRLGPKKIIIISSAPQIRFPDCYGIDMAKLEDFVAFRAALELHRLNGNEKEIIDGIYQKCIKSLKNNAAESINYVKELYKPFSYQKISNKIAELLVDKDINSEVKIIFQKVEDLHRACPNHKGDWYFTGNYPTPGGSKIANKSFINFYEGKSQRAY